jgi:pimeloyl-ACP methyl ester carboxylesterase
VIAANWLNHLEFDRTSPVCRHWWEELSREHHVIRYDQRGCGLSDWDTSDPSFEASVGDLESLISALGIDRFALFGASQGGSVAIEYATRHPEKVSHLALYGACAYGWAHQNEAPDRNGRHCSVSQRTAGAKSIQTTNGRS